MATWASHNGRSGDQSRSGSENGGRKCSCGPSALSLLVLLLLSLLLLIFSTTQSVSAHSWAAVDAVLQSSARPCPMQSRWSGTTYVKPGRTTISLCETCHGYKPSPRIWLAGSGILNEDRASARACITLANENDPLTILAGDTNALYHVRGTSNRDRGLYCPR